MVKEKRMMGREWMNGCVNSSSSTFRQESSVYLRVKVLIYIYITQSVCSRDKVSLCSCRATALAGDDGNIACE